jgi:hypothetical protein
MPGVAATPVRRIFNATSGGGIATVAVAWALLWFVALSPDRRRPEGDWHITTGRVVAPGTSDGRLPIVYRYSVGEQSFLSREYLGTPATAYDAEERPSIGESLTVFHDAQIPGRSRLTFEPDPRNLPAAGLIGTALFCGLNTSFAGIPLRWRRV